MLCKSPPERLFILNPVNMVRIQVQDHTGRPFIPFTSQSSSYHLTMLYPEDASALASLLSDPRISSHLSRAPSNYTINDAHKWILMKTEEFAQFHALDWSDSTAVNKALQTAIPFHVIRYQNGAIIGDVSIRRNDFETMVLHDSDEREKLLSANNRRPPGDPEIDYSLGKAQHSYLSPYSFISLLALQATTSVLQLGVGE